MSASVALAAALLPAGPRSVLLEVGGWLLVAAFLVSLYRVYRIAVRFVYFVDSVSPKHLPIVRQFRRWKASRSARPTYSHNTIPVPTDLKEEITRILSESTNGLFNARDGLDPNSLAVAVEHQGQGNRLLAELALGFLKRGYSIQYMTASRHPIEFIGFLKCFIENKNERWHEYTKQIVVVDAYSPHFAFIDSIYPRKTRQLESLDITCVDSKMTYAGVHSASSRAFKTIKKQLGKNEHRKPTLVVYEDFHAIFSWSFVVINKDSYDRLTPEQQEAMQEAMFRAVAAQRALAIRQNRLALDALIERGMDYYEISAAELAKFREATLPVYDLVREQAGDAAVDAALTAIERCNS